MWISVHKNTITANSAYPGGPAIRFLRRFDCDKKVSKAELSISALGIFRVEINGREIDEYFMPGYTNYNRYVHLCSYDITKDVLAQNRIAVTVADGWFAGRLGYTSGRAIFGEELCLYARVKITYEDGSVETIETDESWKAYPSEIEYADFFNGEHVDENKRIDAFSAYDCLENAVVVDEKRELRPYDMEPVVCVGTLQPKVLDSKDSILLDFGQNFAGVLNFSAQGKQGVKLVIRHAEMLDEHGQMYMENLRSAWCTDSLILSSKPCRFAPKFTYHGFRYAEITAVEGSLDDVEITDIVGLVLSQKLQRTGEFECSDAIINKVYQNAYWGQLGNFISVPTDCPQRDERLGWTGDTQIFCDSAMYNADCDRFYRNYLDIMRADCTEEGAVPSFTPMFIEVNPQTCGSPCWGDAIAVIPYNHYLFYGDKRILEENLPQAKKWIEYYRAHLNDKNVVDSLFTYGDWLSVQETTDRLVMMQCYYGYSLLLVAKMCEIMGEDATVYKQWHAEAKAAFRKELVDEKGLVTSDTQTAYLVAYVAEYLSGDEIRVPLTEAIHRRGDTLTTGFVGVRFLLPVLSDIGEKELAYKLMQNTQYPSWGYSVVNGATTIWERWNGYTKETGFYNPSMNSFNHYSLGSCVYWLYAYVLGIRPMAGKGVRIAPVISEKLQFARGRYALREGQVSVSWKVEESGILFEVEKEGEVSIDFDFGERAVLSKETDGEKYRFILQKSV